MGPIHLPAGAPVLPLGGFAAESAVEYRHHLSLVERGAVLEWVLSRLEGTLSSVRQSWQHNCWSSGSRCLRRQQFSELPKKQELTWNFPPKKQRNAPCYNINPQSEKTSHLTF
jgi:hypothetical protein